MVNGIVIKDIILFKITGIIDKIIINSKITYFNCRVCYGVFEINTIPPFLGYILFAFGILVPS